VTVPGVVTEEAGVVAGGAGGRGGEVQEEFVVLEAVVLVVEAEDKEGLDSETSRAEFEEEAVRADKLFLLTGLLEDGAERV